MIRLRPGLWTMESSSSWGCNTHLVEDEDRVVLVDPGPTSPAEADHTHGIDIEAPGEEVQRSLGERLDTWTVLHPHVPALRQALALPTLAWRLGLGPALSRIGNANSHLVMLTVTGRKSGRPRHVPVAVHERRGEAYLWCPYGGRAQWYRNILADPVVTVQSGDGTHTMRAEAIDDVDHVIELVADLRDFDETFLRSYLASEGIEDTPEAIAANAHRVHVRRLAPTTETGPPPLAADLKWAWLVPTAVIAAGVVLRTRRTPVSRPARLVNDAGGGGRALSRSKGQS